MIYSNYQSAIFSWIEQGSGHAVVDAKAGSGKTTTLVEAARRVDASKGVLFLAFNKHIAEEIGTRLGSGNASARTIHSVGNQALSSQVKGCKLDTRKYSKLAKEWIDRNGSKFAPDERGEIAQTLTKLLNFARLTLVNVRDNKALELMCSHFDIEIEEHAALLFSAIPTILEQGKAMLRSHKSIDFTDMIWLPIALNLSLVKYDFLLVDECQDLNACQLELVMRMCKPTTRILFVGDENQAIFGFAGADNRSVSKIIERTGATVLPLSICYRCPASHIELAQMVVPEIEPRPNAPTGTVSFAREDDLQKMVTAGDLVICRLTAPLIKECIRLIKQRVSARVRGRDIGKDLVSLLKKIAKIEGFSYDKVVARLEDYRVKQEEFLRQKDADESVVESLNDRVSCLQVCAENFLNAKSVDDLAAEIEALFDDNRPAVWLSTVHRAKGLEADRVFILRTDKLPLRWKNQQAWQYAQEMNLLYVALTRAKQSLVFIGELPDPCQEREDVQPQQEALEIAAEMEQMEQMEAEQATTADDAMKALEEAIEALDDLTHDLCAMYMQDKIREAAEEVKRRFEQLRYATMAKEYSTVVDPICGRELLCEEEFLYCPEHGGPLSSLVERQHEREEQWQNSEATR